MLASHSRHRRVLVLGGSGFIGRPLVHVLRARGDSVMTLSRSDASDITLDATDTDALTQFLARERFDTIVNLMGAGLATESADAATLAAINTELPSAVLRALMDHGDGTAFIHAASSTERTQGEEQDESAYSRSKYEGSQALRTAATDSNIPIALLRLHNTYGPRQPATRFVANTIAALAQGSPVTLNYPQRVRDLVFIDDVVASFTTAIDRVGPGLTEADIGTGIGTTLFDAARLIADTLGQPTSLVRAAVPAMPDSHPYAVAETPGGAFGTCVTSLKAGIIRTIGDH